MVRPDLERLLLYHQSLPDPAARLDDILLTACSDWVNEYSGLVSTVAGPAGHLPRAGHEARAGAVAPAGRVVVAVARSHRRRDLESGGDAVVAGGAGRYPAAHGALRGRVAERAGDRRHRGSRPAADRQRAGDLLAGTGAGRHRHRAGRHRQQPPPDVRVGVGGDGSRAGAGHPQHRDERRGAGAADDEPADPSGRSAAPRRAGAEAVVHHGARGEHGGAGTALRRLGRRLPVGRADRRGRPRPHRGDRPRLPRAAVGIGDAARRGGHAPVALVPVPDLVDAAARADGAPDAVGGRVVRASSACPRPRTRRSSCAWR